jgi:hypothetical protein
MSKLNLSVVLNAYDDNRPSNAPSRNPIKWARDMQGLSVNNPSSADYAIDPGTTQLLFSGMRTLLQDGTTEYSLALAPNQTSIYALTWDGGTAPNFRTPRTTGADATTQITTSVNGPVETFTSSTGTQASFTGMIAGMTTPVTITATNIGLSGNSVVLTADGTSSINTLIANWNTANPSNLISLTSGDGTQIPAAGSFASYTGTPAGTTLPITLTANTIGAVGNSIALTGDGVSTVAQLIVAWNTANPGNMVTQTAGIGTQIPNNGVAIDLSGGANPDTIDLSGGTVATPMSLLTGGVVVGDYVTIGSEFNLSNQGTFQIIAVTATSFSVVNPNPVVEGPILLGSGFASQIQIYSAAGVQVGDTIVISSGFSPVVWGSYQITAVYAESLQFSSTAILPSQSSIMTEPVIYSNAKSLIYMESDSALTVIINGTPLTGTLTPFVVTNCATGLPTSALGYPTPGMLLLTATIWSLSVTNNSVDQANVFLAAVE